MDTAPAIDVSFSPHALTQAQRRGISSNTLDLVLTAHDRSRKVPGLARALWISPKRRASLITSGMAAKDVARTAGVRLIVSLKDDVVFTVEHATAKRRWV